ncbi:Uncharacterised protein [Vibrio cholerae]|nr:Uncharacterised protein [Vibrio cholerae]
MIQHRDNQRAEGHHLKSLVHQDSSNQAHAAGWCTCGACNLHPVRFGTAQDSQSRRCDN